MDRRLAPSRLDPKPQEEMLLDHDEGWVGLRRGGECPEGGGSEEWSRSKRDDKTDESEIDILGQPEAGP